MTTELSLERSAAQRLEAEKQNYERTTRELRAKIVELENLSQSRSRAQITALEVKINNLEDQLNTETIERANALRQYRRLEKRYADLTFAKDEEKRNAETRLEEVLYIILRVS